MIFLCSKKSKIKLLIARLKKDREDALIKNDNRKKILRTQKKNTSKVSRTQNTENTTTQIAKELLASPLTTFQNRRKKICKLADKKLSSERTEYNHTKTRGQVKKMNIETRTKFKKHRSGPETIREPIIMPAAKQVVTKTKSKNKSSKKTATQSKNLEKKRMQNREKAKRYRERKKQDPNLSLIQKEKEHHRYLKRKEEGKLKLIADVSVREKRRLHKKWRQNSQNYRMKKSLAALTENFASLNSPPKTPTNVDGVQDDILHHINDEIPKIDKRASGRKKVRRDRSTMYRNLKATQDKLQASTRAAERYKKRLQRLKTATSVTQTPSPKTKVKQLLHGRKIPRDVKKQLEYGECLEKQLRNNSKLKKQRKKNNCLQKWFVVP